MTATLAFDKPGYAPSDTIVFTVDAGAPMSATTTVTGSVELPDGTVLPAESSTTIEGVYGPFAADGYTVVQDPDVPNRFVATPVG